MFIICFTTLVTFVFFLGVFLIPDQHRSAVRTPRPDKPSVVARRRKVIPHPEVAEMWVIKGSLYQSMSRVFLEHLAAKLDEVDPLPELPARRPGGPVTTVVTADPVSRTGWSDLQYCKYCKSPMTADHSSEYIWSFETSGPVCVVCRTRFGMVKAFVTPEEAKNAR